MRRNQPVTAAAVCLGGALAFAPCAEAAHLDLRLAESSSPAAIASAASTPARSGQARVADPAAYEQAKHVADAAAPSGLSSALAFNDSTPTVVRNWEGIRGLAVTPTDSTSAIGPTRFLELVNSNYAIYDRVSKTPLSTGSLFDLSGCLYCEDPGDPQVIWDATTRRFYVVFLETARNGNALMFSFSRTNTPNGPADWCSYSLDFGPVIPDYPKLGDTASLVLIGVNAFSSDDDDESEPSYIGSNLLWISKPPAGPGCPEADSFFVDNVPIQNGFTPVPANQIDRSETGWAVAIEEQQPGDALRVYRISRSAGGGVTVDADGVAIEVPEYEIPPNAPQKGSNFVLDTLDGRTTQAVSAIDPRFDRVALWTQHTVKGGVGSHVRWYELDPEGQQVLQVGAATWPNLFTFNGAISPDRLRRGNTARFGSNMVLSFNTSSAATYPALFVTSKIEDDPMTTPVRIASSIGPVNTFDCSQGGGVCRWGDYAGASPDPKAPADALTGKVWGSSMLAFPIQTYNFPISRTRNFVVRP